MDNIQQVITFLVGLVTMGLIASAIQATIWCAVAWLFFRKWFNK